MRRDEALRLLSEHREELKEFKVESLAVFGSVARDEAGPSSDVDLLVEFRTEARVGLFEFVRLKMRLEEILGRPVDLGTFRSLRPHMRERVLRDAVDVA